VQKRQFELDKEDQAKFEASRKRAAKGLIPDWLRYTEAIIIFIYLICAYSYINTFTIQDTSYFNDTILKVFNEQDDCLNYFIEIQSTIEANRWLYNCYITTLQNHMIPANVSSNITDGNSTNKVLISDSNSTLNFENSSLDYYLNDEFTFFIQSSQIQINDYKLVDCNNNPFKIQDIQNSPPSQCLSGDSITLSEKKPFLKTNFLLNVTEGITKQDNFSTLEYLMFTTVNLDNPSIININNIESDVNNLKTLLQISYMVKVSKYNQDISYMFQTDTQKKIMTVLQNIAQNTNEDSSYDIVDKSTVNMNVVTYFWSNIKNQSSQFLGIVVFRYIKADDGTINCHYNNYSAKILNFAQSGSFSVAEIISLLMAFFLIVCFYLKFIHLNNIWKVLAVSVFYFGFFFLLILEYLFKVNLILKSVFDYSQLSEIDVGSYDVVIFSIENIKIIKSFGVIFICYHLI
jgi:hypothetical protein